MVPFFLFLSGGHYPPREGTSLIVPLFYSYSVEANGVAESLELRFVRAGRDRGLAGRRRLRAEVAAGRAEAAAGRA
jgi:hypothetical protein